MRYKHTLCQNNNSVQSELKELRKKIKSTKFPLMVSDEFIVEVINKCLVDLRIMKKQGQSLENRCRLYRRAIEKLGFTRKEGKKK